MSAEVVARATTSALAARWARGQSSGGTSGSRSRQNSSERPSPRHIRLPSSGSSSARARSVRRRRDRAPRQTVRASSVTSTRSAPGAGVAGPLEGGHHPSEGVVLVGGQVRVVPDRARGLARRGAVGRHETDVLQAQQQRLPLGLDAVGVVAGRSAGATARQPRPERHDRRDEQREQHDEDRRDVLGHEPQRPGAGVPVVVPVLVVGHVARRTRSRVRPTTSTTRWSGWRWRTSRRSAAPGCTPARRRCGCRGWARSAPSPAAGSTAPARRGRRRRRTTRSSPSIEPGRNPTAIRAGMPAARESITIAEANCTQ